MLKQPSIDRGGIVTVRVRQGEKAEGEDRAERFTKNKASDCIRGGSSCQSGC